MYALPEPISVDLNTVVNDTIIGTPIDKSQRIYTTDLDYADQDTGDISVSLKGNMIWRVTFVQEVPW